MASVADYLVLRDGPVNIAHGERFETRRFFAPNDLVEGTDRAKAILQYKARPLQNLPFSPQVDLKISTKNRQLNIETVTLKGDRVRGMWETFPATEFSTIVNNIFVFESLSGPVRISDVVLWYQRNI